MIKILLAAALIAVSMFVVKHDRVLERAGLFGYCSAVPADASGRWRACHSGRISGAPDLSLKSCKKQRRMGTVDYWTCPTAIGSSPVRG